MFKSIITLKKDLSQEKIKELHEIIENAFDNHAGKCVNTSNDPYVLCFEDNDIVHGYYGTLGTGQVNMDKNTVLPYLEKWDCIDEEEPDESGSILDYYKEEYPHLFVL